MVTTTFDTCFARTSQLIAQSDRIINGLHRGMSDLVLQTAATRETIRDSFEAISRVSEQMRPTKTI